MPNLLCTGQEGPFVYKKTEQASKHYFSMVSVSVPASCLQWLSWLPSKWTVARIYKINSVSSPTWQKLVKKNHEGLFIWLLFEFCLRVCLLVGWFWWHTWFCFLEEDYVVVWKCSEWNNSFLPQGSFGHGLRDSNRKETKTARWNVCTEGFSAEDLMFLITVSKYLHSL